MDNKGFTLVELVVTIVLLGIVISIGGYSIINVINSSREKAYELLINDIKSAVELYYQECTYASGTVIAECHDTVTLGKLVEYGYLKGNDKRDDGTKLKIVNPKANEDSNDISDCIVSYSYDSGKVLVSAVDSDNVSCPTDYYPDNER